MNRETRVSLRKKTMKYIEKALDNHQTIPLSEDTYVDGLGDVVNRTITKEGMEFVLYKMERNDPGVFKRTVLQKQEALLMIEKHIGTFNKRRLSEELEYWKECEFFLQEEENNITFINSYVSGITLN